MIIIGITGTLGSGKGTVVKHLVGKYGFRHFSASDFIVDELTLRGMPKTRDNMLMVANELRAKYSPSYIVESLFQQAKEYGGNSVIESIRAIGEVKALKSKPGKFFLLAVDADQKLRYQRVRGRKSSKDFISFEKFQEDEKAEMNDPDPAKLNLSACITMADALITNDSTPDRLRSEVDRIATPLLAKDGR